MTSYGVGDDDNSNYDDDDDDSEDDATTPHETCEVLVCIALYP